MSRKYEIRYGFVDPDYISDRVIVYNPKYGESIGPWGSRPVSPPQSKIERLYPFYENLEKSIEEEGFRNPIFCNSIEFGTFCKYGTSRLWIAKKKNLDIPCIIADFVEQWKSLELLQNKEDVENKFQDMPQVLELEEEYMRIDACRA
jgi:hypothetical protein